jgi:hypothetical protein
LNAPRLNILRPLFVARAPFWCVVEGMLNGEMFPDVFAIGPKSFHPVEELFRSGVAGRGGPRRRPDAEAATVRPYWVRPSSPESQPTASDLSGSEARVLVSLCPHLAHSNARFSKPSGPSETPAVLIRIWHLGQRGRWIGNSSGSVFFELAIIVENSENPKMRLFGLRLLNLI